ncbi:hypothetical protein [Nonomuraea dietziae]|uniref:hypothetical protein n=1 Tax=Nonomuraea dietziae TaxID=65515 RepID=UPI0033FBAA3B
MIRALTSPAAPAGQYGKALARLDAAVAAMVADRLDAAHARIAAGVRPARAEFDLVRGLTGFGAYLFGRDSHGAQLRQILAYLVRLTDPIPAADAAGPSVPGWWTLDNHGRWPSHP